MQFDSLVLCSHPSPLTSPRFQNQTADLILHPHVGCQSTLQPNCCPSLAPEVWEKSQKLFHHIFD